MSGKQQGVSIKQLAVLSLFTLVTYACQVQADKPWVTGYIPAYAQGQGGSMPFMEPEDWKMLTHVVHNSISIKPDGSLDFDANLFSPANRAAAIREAHQQGVPILLGLSGWITNYQQVVNDASARTVLVNGLLAVMREGYDGIDVDLEPLTEWGKEKAGNPGYVAFVNELHAAMQSYKPPLSAKPLLMVAIIGRDCVVLTGLESKLDQINLMLYDMASTWEDMTWHDSALYSGKDVYAGTDKKVASVEREVEACQQAGLPRHKLGLGINLETRLWIGGVSEPRQSWGMLAAKPRHYMTSPDVPKESYADLLKKYYKPEYYQWDDSAKVPYLKIDKPGSKEDMFVSFNDERSVQEKVQYMRKAGLGGLMIWSMQLDYRPEQPEGQRRPIMKAIRAAF